MGAACIGIGPLRHRGAALVAVARRHEFLDPLSHVCRAGNNLNSLCLMIKWLPAAGHIATSRPRSGGPLTGPPGPVQAYFESQQPHGSLSVLPKLDPNWPWRQVGAGPAASPQCLPMARSGPCTSLGVRVGLVDFARPRVSSCRGMREPASQNIYFIFCTLETSQLLSGWLKDAAPFYVTHCRHNTKSSRD